MQPLQSQYLVDFTFSGPASGLEQEVREAFPQIRPQTMENDRFRLAAEQPVPIGPLVRFFEARGIEVTEARKVQSSLEDVFVEITGVEATAIKREKEKGANSK